MKHPLNVFLSLYIVRHQVKVFWWQKTGEKYLTPHGLGVIEAKAKQEQEKYLGSYVVYSWEHIKYDTRKAKVWSQKIRMNINLLCYQMFLFSWWSNTKQSQKHFLMYMAFYAQL